MRHPLSILKDHHWRNWFWTLLTLTLIATSVLQLVGERLSTEAAPQGIVSFELAGSAPGAAMVLDSWDATARVYAAFSLGFDYVYMVLYSTTIALGCLWATRKLRHRGWSLAKIGIVLAWGQWLAAAFDAVENAALWRLLIDPAMGSWPTLAWWCAVLKFGLIGLGLLYVLAGVLASLIRRSDFRTTRHA